MTNEVFRQIAGQCVDVSMHNYAYENVSLYIVVNMSFRSYPLWGYDTRLRCGLTLSRLSCRDLGLWFAPLIHVSSIRTSRGNHLTILLYVDMMIACEYRQNYAIDFLMMTIRKQTYVKVLILITCAC